MGNLMRAWVIEAYGAPKDVLTLQTIDRPKPVGSQVLVRVLASSINPIDLRMVQGYGAKLRKLATKKEFPFISGRDVVGEVIEVGPDATKFKVGDRVAGINDIKEIGGHAEFSAIDEKNLATAPTNVSAENLAAIPYVAMTTWTALVTKVKLDPENAAGKHLFVHAGSGGIGSFTIQWARALGMRVSTTCSTSNVDWVRELGAETVVDYRNEDYRQVVSDVDYAYDTLGGAYAKDTAALVSAGGGYASIVHPIMPYTDSYGSLLGGLAILGDLGWKKVTHRLRGRRYAWSICQPSEAGIAHVMKKVEAGQIKPTVEQVLPMGKIVDGFEHVERGSAKGKTVLTWD